MFMYSRLYVFFFQAEDGIRDRNVTGVQTCALPICSILPELRVIDSGLLKGFVIINPRWAGFKPADYYQASISIQATAEQQEESRSEERRVGKESRARKETARDIEKDIEE